ncbi:MAG: hypothetical protein AAGM67_09770, partial [Bacteroidota bacterium]
AEDVKAGIVPKRWVLLKFPNRKGKGAVNLSVKEIYYDPEVKDEHALELDFYPVFTDHSEIGKHVTWYASYKVVCHDDDPRGDRKRGKPTAAKKLSKQAEKAAQFKSVYAKNARPLTRGQAQNSAAQAQQAAANAAAQAQGAAGQAANNAIPDVNMSS